MSFFSAEDLVLAPEPDLPLPDLPPEDEPDDLEPLPDELESEEVAAGLVGFSAVGAGEEAAPRPESTLTDGAEGADGLGATGTITFAGGIPSGPFEIVAMLSDAFPDSA